MHDEMQEDPEEDFAPRAVQVEDDALLPITTKDPLRLLPDPLQVDTSDPSSVVTALSLTLTNPRRKFECSKSSIGKPIKKLFRNAFSCFL